MNEKSIRGPKEGFSENYIDNISMIRRRINNQDLKFQKTASAIMDRNANKNIRIKLNASIVEMDNEIDITQESIGKQIVDLLNR